MCVLYMISIASLRTSDTTILFSSVVNSTPLLNSHCVSSPGSADMGPTPVRPGLTPFLCSLLGKTLHSLLLLHHVSSRPRTRNLVASLQSTPFHSMLLSITASATSSADSCLVRLGYRLTASVPMMTILLLLSWTHLLSISLPFTLSHLLNAFVLFCVSISLLSLSSNALFLFPLCFTEEVTNSNLSPTASWLSRLPG